MNVVQRGIVLAVGSRQVLSVMVRRCLAPDCLAKLAWLQTSKTPRSASKTLAGRQRATLRAQRTAEWVHSIETAVRSTHLTCEARNEECSLNSRITSGSVLVTSSGAARALGLSCDKLTVLERRTPELRLLPLLLFFALGN
jgi:hypothetical protein